MMRMKKKLSVWILLFALLLGMMPETVRAALPSKESMTILRTYTGSVDGVERTLFAGILPDGTTSQYIKIGDAESNLLWYGNLDVGIDQYGAVWILDSDHTIMWWSYDLSPSFENMLDTIGFWPIRDPVNSEEARFDVESLIFEGTGEQAIVTGYKTFSGEICPLLSFDEMKEKEKPENSIPEPFYIPKGMELLITPRPKPTATPVPSTPTPGTPLPSLPTPVPTKPASTPTLKPTAPAAKTPAPQLTSNRVSIQTTKKTKAIYEGNTLLGQYTLKKNTLTWKGTRKSGKVKGVKYAGYIKKSKNLVYITKKGAAYTVSLKTGKKKLLVKKKRKAKKLIKSGKFVTKIKTKSGKVDIRNK